MMKGREKDLMMKKMSIKYSAEQKKTSRTPIKGTHRDMGRTDKTDKMNEIMMMMRSPSNEIKAERKQQMEQRK